MMSNLSDPDVFTQSPGEAAAISTANAPAMTPLVFSPAAAQAVGAALNPISLSTTPVVPVAAAAPAVSGMSTGEVVGLIAVVASGAGLIYWVLASQK